MRHARAGFLMMAAAVLDAGCRDQTPVAASSRRVIRLVTDTTTSQPLALEYARSLPNIEVGLVNAVGSGATVGAMHQRILIVEDDAGLSRVLTDNLAFEGFEVQAVADGNLAAAAARSFAPDLVILDITLPGKSGLDLCRLWREEPRIPIILLTARADRKDKVTGLKLGADDYVTKPFDLEPDPHHPRFIHTVHGDGSR